MFAVDRSIASRLSIKKCKITILCEIVHLDNIMKFSQTIIYKLKLIFIIQFTAFYIKMLTHKLECFTDKGLSGPTRGPTKLTNFRILNKNDPGFTLIFILSRQVTNAKHHISQCQHLFFMLIFGQFFAFFEFLAPIHSRDITQEGRENKVRVIDFHFVSIFFREKCNRSSSSFALNIGTGMLLRIQQLLKGFRRIDFDRRRLLYQRNILRYYV